METGSLWERIEMTTKEIAKKIRTDLKALKGYKFSVRTEYFSGGSSIDIHVMKSPIRMIKTIDDITEVAFLMANNRRYTKGRNKNPLPFT